MLLSLHPDFVNDHYDEPPCPGCWEGFPRPCRCGGQIHAERDTESEAGDIWLKRWCTICGVNWDEPVRA